MKNVWTAVVLMSALFMIGGCGSYSTTSRTAGDIKDISVPYFDNDTAEPNIEIEITQRIIDGIINDNTLKVVSGEESDAVLEGTITEYRNEPFTFAEGAGSDIQAEQYRLFIQLEVSLFDRSKNQYVWENQSLQAHGDYYLESTTEQNYENALKNVYTDLVDGILSNTVQDW